MIIKYKSYEESRLATGFSAMGGLLIGFGSLATFAAIVICFSDNKEPLKRCFIMGIVMLIMGGISIWLSQRRITSVINKRLSLSNQEVEELIAKKPKLKEWFVEYHEGYKMIHSAEIEHQKIQVMNEKRVKEEKATEDLEKSKKYSIIAFVIIIVIVFAISAMNK